MATRDLITPFFDLLHRNTLVSNNNDELNKAAHASLVGIMPLVLFIKVQCFAAKQKIKLICAAVLRSAFRALCRIPLFSLQLLKNLTRGKNQSPPKPSDNSACFCDPTYKRDGQNPQVAKAILRS